MNSKNLLIVFVKNPVQGKAKTRLAATIGAEAALDVYKELISITEKATSKISDCDLHVYFSSEIDESLWPGKVRFIQQAADLGERMYSAFYNGFELGYHRIVGVGSDLPDLNSETISKGISALSTNDVAFGPSDDGGYYLIGMSQPTPCIFENKKWSTESLLDETTRELSGKSISYSLLETLNDVDTIEDLRSSSLSDKFSEYL